MSRPRLSIPATVNRRWGFTLVELVIVIVIIGILTTLATVVYSNVETRAHDSARSVKASSIANALESYYLRNGEYPGCSQLTGAANTVVGSGGALSDLTQSDIVTPLAPSGTTNSIQCRDLTSTSQPDIFAYVGDGSSDCSGNGVCLRWTLKYREDATGTIKTITSRHQAILATSGAITLSASTVSQSEVDLSWNSIANAAGYQLQRADDNQFTTGLVSSNVTTTTSAATALSVGSNYFFRVRATLASDVGDWSNTATATTPISAPAAPTLTASYASGHVTATSSSVTCPSGSVAKYSFQARSSSNGSWSGWSAWSASSTSQTYQVSASQGYQYQLEATAYCVADISSSASSASSVASSTVPISQPAAPGYAGPGSFSSGAYGVVNYSTSCPAGTSVSNGNFTSQSWTGAGFGPHPFGFNDWWTLPDGVNSANVQYWGRYQCTSSYATSPTSPDSSNVINVHR